MRFEIAPALSIRQPWAELIASGRKSIEIRRGTPSYRGLIWIHAGKKEDAESEANFGFAQLFKGGYIGAVDLKNIVPFDPERWEKWRNRHLDPGPFKPNLFAWIVATPVRFLVPVPGSGKLGLFEVPLDTRRMVIRAYDEARKRTEKGSSLNI